TIGWPDVESTTAAYKISAVNAVEGSKYPLLPHTALTEPASARRRWPEPVAVQNVRYCRVSRLSGG
ncbi:hypothetical protein, partial [Nocardia sp. NPDC004711]